MTKKEQRAKKIARQQEITTAARTASRELTDAETREFEGLQAEIDALAPQVADEERQAAEAETQRVLTAERQRVADITEICRTANLTPTQYINDGSTVDAVRKAALDELIRNGTPARVHVTEDEGDKFRAAATDGFLARANLRMEHPTDGSNDFRNMSLRDLAIECRVREGSGDTSKLLRMSGEELYSELCRDFYNPTAAFPSIMDSAIKKSIVEMYNHAGTSFERFTTKGSLSDFKETPEHEYAMGSAPELDRVPENGELKNSTLDTTMLPHRKLETYGKQFSMSRQAFINDDIGFLSRVPGKFAQAAKRQINKGCYQLLYNNPSIFDEKAFFSTDHKNLIASGTAMTAAAIKAMRTSLRKQTDQFGEAIMVNPNFLILPVSEDYDYNIKSIFLSQTIQTTENTQAANPLYGMQFDVISDNTLNVLAGTSACPWFMGDSGIPCIKVDYLNGNESPIVRRSERPGTLGFVWDFYLDWGITAVDFRGMVKNPGTTL